MKYKETVSFDDVLLTPQYSRIKSRSEIDLKNNLGKKEFSLPIVSSPMDTVTEDQMAAALSALGGLGVIHRYNSIEEQADLVDKTYEAISDDFVCVSADCDDFDPAIGAAVGITGDFLERTHALIEAGASIICVDVAHGHHVLVKKAIKSLKDSFADKAHFMVGNVATPRAFKDLVDWGADSVRVGVGGGSICSTRIQTGHGLSTLQSILDCAPIKGSTKLIADGGIRTSGDATKALAAGADFVMLGSLLAGTDESPGQIYTAQDDKQYKVYRGMASREAQEDWRGKISSLEGISTTIPYKGSVYSIVCSLERGIRSGLSYSGAQDLAEFFKKAKFALQTNAGQIESSTHILRRM